MKTTAIILALLLSCMPSMAYGIDVELHYIPPGKSFLLDGEELRLYTFEEWKILVEVDSELYHVEQKISMYRRDLELYNRQVRILGRDIVAAEEQISSLKENNEWLVAEYDNMSKELAKAGGAASKDNFWSSVMLVAGVLLSVVGTTMIVTSRLSR